MLNDNLFVFFLFKSEQEIDQALIKQPKQIESYFQRLAKAQEFEAQKEAKKKDIYNIARDHFGYDVNLKDSRLNKIFCGNFI